MSTVRIAGREVTIERPTVAKGSRVLTLINLLQREMPEFTRELASFRREYVRDYADELTRTQAMLQFPDRVIYDNDDNPVLNPSTGEAIVVPSALSRITEEEWERNGHTLRIPREPSIAETALQMVPLLIERAEQPFMRLLGLMILDNDTVNRYVKAGDIWERVDEVVDTLIRPAGLDEVAEVLVVTFEVIDRDVIGKVRALGKRAQPLMRMLGLSGSSERTDSTTSSGPPAKPNTISVSDSPDSSSGPVPDLSSGSPGTPSERSEMSLTPSAS